MKKLYIYILILNLISCSIYNKIHNNIRKIDLSNYKKDEKLQNSYKVNKNKETNIQKNCDRMYNYYLQNDKDQNQIIENCETYTIK